MNNSQPIPYTCLFLCLFIILANCSKEAGQFHEKYTDKTFADVVQDTEFIITENNFRITNRLHIGDAIQKRGSTDFPKNEVVLFCNLTLAEEMLKIEPRYIHYCPYKITITESNKQVLIGTRLLPIDTGNQHMDNFSEKMNKLLRSMIEYAASNDPFIIEFDDIDSNQL